MQPHDNHDTYNSNDRSRDSMDRIVLTVLIVAILGLGIYLLVAQFHVRREQLVEGSIYLGCGLGDPQIAALLGGQNVTRLPIFLDTA